MNLIKVKGYDIMSSFKGYCVNCGKQGKNIRSVMFTYLEASYYFQVCEDCYLFKIKDKPLCNLELFIPLLRMKEGRYIEALEGDNREDVYFIGKNQKRYNP